jgi:hypothetical protein
MGIQDSVVATILAGERAQQFKAGLSSCPGVAQPARG